MKGSTSKKYEYQDLVERTKFFAVSIIRLYGNLPKTNEAQMIGKQLLRSGISVGANYREALRSRTDQEFISKIHISLQELEETRYWLELLVASEITTSDIVIHIQEEARQIVAILVTMIKRKKSQLRDQPATYNFDSLDNLLET